MSNATDITAARELKAARQSVRAKVRKALAVEGANLTAAQTKSLTSVLESLNKTLAAKAKPKAKAAKAATTKKAGTSKSTKKAA